MITNHKEQSHYFEHIAPLAPTSHSLLYSEDAGWPIIVNGAPL